MPHECMSVSGADGRAVGKSSSCRSCSNFKSQLENREKCIMSLMVELSTALANLNEQRSNNKKMRSQVHSFLPLINLLYKIEFEHDIVNGPPAKRVNKISCVNSLGSD